MSGIAGIIHFDGTPVKQGLVESMTASMPHRGPDGIRHWHSGQVALGQCMLRTTAESLEEEQPWSNEDKSLTLVMDGRVDNWIELRKTLLGHGLRLRNRSDAELVLRAYELWGEDCTHHIEGDFAFMIWNDRDRSAYCARDRLGNKPFYYHWNGKALVFASEPHAILLAPWVIEKLNDGMLVEYFAGEWHSRDETLWEGVYRLVPGHQLILRDGKFKISQYWRPDLHVILPYKSDHEYFDHYRELLFDCVRRLSRSHCPVSIEVSGGLDSSSVFSIAEKLRLRGELATEKLAAYSLSFTQQGAQSELEYSRHLARYFDIEINEVPASLPPLQWFENMARQYRDFSGFPNGAMFEGIRQASSAKGSRVTLTGEGGDQWLQGGEKTYYREELTNRNWPALMQCIRADLSSTGFTQTTKSFLRYGCFPLLPPALQIRLKKIRHLGSLPPDRQKFWLTNSARQILDERRKKYAKQIPDARSFGQIELLNTLYEPFTDHVMDNAERLAARHATELRYPYRDARFVQFAFNCPERMRQRGGRSKYIHVKAMEGVLPPDILNRTSKAEFSIAFRLRLDALKDVYLAQHERGLTPRMNGGPAPLVDPQGLKTLYSSYMGDDQAGWTLWPLWSIWAIGLLTDTTCDR